MKTYVLDGQTCPYCGYKMDRVSTESHRELPREPQPEDFTLCVKCTEICVFNKDFSLRKPTPEDIAILEQQGLMQPIKAIQNAAKMRGAMKKIFEN